MLDDDELQDYLLTAAGPLGSTVLPADYDHPLSNSPLYDAIVAIYDRNGDLLSTAEQAKLTQQCGNLSQELRQAMALILYAMDEASVNLAEAFSDFSPGIKSAVRRELGTYPLHYYNSEFLSDVFDEWEKTDQAELLNGATKFLSAITKAEAYFAIAPDSSLDEILFEFDTPIGFVMVGGALGNTYDSNTNGVRETNALLIDIGGDDRYEGRTCGASDEDTPLSVSIDLAGNDVYESSKFGCQGWGMFGIGVLVDVFGDDTYIAGDHAQGASTCGIGILRDVYGNDVHIGEMMVQGASACGVGLLDDESGDDVYYSPKYAQGFGFTFGSGVLRDVEGDDFYFVGGFEVDFRENQEGKERYVCMGQGFGYGPRRDNENWQGAGGIGVLSDGSGNDYYLGDYFCQGSSYWFATGILDDKAGDDVYVARRYSTGAGIHNSVGVLVDESGNDEYWNWGVGIGHGLDASVGIVVDVEGNDHYSANGWYTMGHGGDGLGVLLDNAGNDMYSILSSGGLGCGAPYMGNYRVPLGIFIDANGTDSYTREHNEAFWTKDETGVAIDMTGGDTGCLMP